MDDLLERMRRNPQGDWTIADISKLCARHAVACDAPTGGGSHYKLSHPTQREILTIPARRPVKPFYMKGVVRFIDQLQEHKDGG